MRNTPAPAVNFSLQSMSPDVCPNCGAEVPSRAKACPECGSDENTGWSEEARHSSLDLPNEHFDYDDYVEREFNDDKPVPRGIHWFWWLIAVLILAALFWLWF
jgi:ribosomal protein L40E